MHFQQHGSRCRMWVAPEIRDPVCCHAPTRKSISYFGAVRIRDGRLVVSKPEGRFDAQTCWSFLRILRRRARRRVVGSWSSPTTPDTTMPSSTPSGVGCRRQTSPCFSFRLTALNSIRSSASGNSCGNSGCTTAISRLSTNSFKSSNRSSRFGRGRILCFDVCAPSANMSSYLRRCV